MHKALWYNYLYHDNTLISQKIYANLNSFNDLMKHYLASMHAIPKAKKTVIPNKYKLNKT